MGRTTMKMTLPRALNTVGGSLIFAYVGASVLYFLKGARGSCKGQRHAGGAEAVRSNAVRIRHWTALFGLTDAIYCAMIHGRHKEDALTFIVSWGGANALLSMSQGRGARAAVSSGLKGAAFGGAVGVAVCGLKRAREKLES
ncbi:Mitochondrial import inner membrane translocase subunit Tim17 [Hordeum vulgare]|nr:Mitochondrial import inner membrane translocase subunit Tim17 [Hordeum vulgare]